VIACARRLCSWHASLARRRRIPAMAGGLRAGCRAPQGRRRPGTRPPAAPASGFSGRASARRSGCTPPWSPPARLRGRPPAGARSAAAGTRTRLARAQPHLALAMRLCRLPCARPPAQQRLHRGTRASRAAPGAHAVCSPVCPLLRCGAGCKAATCGPCTACSNALLRRFQRG